LTPGACVLLPADETARLHVTDFVPDAKPVLL
jgi:hypothetical protein